MSGSILKYAVLWHQQAEEPHFDLMVETTPGSDLATWRVKEWPIEGAAEMTRLKDHRKLFLTYEGELSGSRGRVERVAGGTCRVEVLEGGLWRVELVDGGPPMKLELRRVDGEQWEGASV